MRRFRASAGVRHTLLGLAMACAAVALADLITGGFTLRAGVLRVSSHAPLRPVALALAASSLYVLFGRRQVAADLSALEGWLERRSSTFAALTAAAACASGLVWGTHAAGGSDSYCYIGQAEEFVSGRLVMTEPLARTVPWANPDRSFAPTGWIPVPSKGGGAVPMCAPGLSLAMAAAWIAAGPGAVHVVVPVLGALAVWLVYVLALALDSRLAGACAALLFAVSPIFLYQIVQPMSDVPAATFWLAAVVLVARASPAAQVLGGLAASMALLTRPNLAPAIVPVAAFVWCCPVPPGVLATFPARMAGAARFAAGVLPGCLVLAWLNVVRYGSPLQSGYGDLGALFSVAHIMPNLRQYPRWVVETQSPFVLFAVFAPLAALQWRQRSSPDGARAGAVLWTCLALIAVVVACYLPYQVFDAWWYIRFLLPALPFLIVLSVVGAHTILRMLPAPVRLPITVLAIVALSIWCLRTAVVRQVFDLQSLERRYVTMGKLTGERLPPGAVVITIQQSGSVRHYGRKVTLLWDALEPGELDQAIEALQASGRSPFIVVEDWEQDGFRERFAGEEFGALDWPPRFEVRDRIHVRLYDPTDRARHFAGERVLTEQIR
jgi:hypothetical protein